MTIRNLDREYFVTEKAFCFINYETQYSLQFSLKLYSLNAVILFDKSPFDCYFCLIKKKTLPGIYVNTGVGP